MMGLMFYKLSVNGLWSGREVLCKITKLLCVFRGILYRMCLYRKAESFAAVDVHL